jgi:hypothetical protein
MKKIIFFLISSLFLTACASSFYSSEKREKNNSFALKSNVSNLTIQFPNAKPKDTEFYNQELTINSGTVFTYPYLRKRLLTVLVSSGDESKTIKIKRKARGGALFKSISLGLFTYAIPLLVDPFNPDFYKISKESKEVFVSFKNSDPTPKKTNEHITENNSRVASTVSVPISSSSSISKPTQVDNNIVTLTVSGYGVNPDKAKVAALRNAIEQAYGVFISTKTEILNDELIKDEIISLSNGNIEHYDVISETKLSDGTYNSLLKAKVSITKLTKFCENKGLTCELKGALFAANAKIQMLNKQSEESLFKNLYDVAIELGKNIYDFNISVSEPRLNNGIVEEHHEGETETVKLKEIENSFYVNVYVKSKLNDNLNSIVSLFEKTIRNITISNNEQANLKSLGMSYYNLSFNGVAYIVRSAKTIQILDELFLKNRLRFFASNFLINNGLKSYNYNLLHDNQFNEMYEFRTVDHPYAGFTKPSKSNDINFEEWSYSDWRVYSINTEKMETDISFWYANVLTLDELSAIKTYTINRLK